jgi:hypothetical protein
VEREVVIPERLLTEVTTEPAATTVRTFVRANEGVRVANVDDERESPVSRSRRSSCWATWAPPPLGRCALEFAGLQVVGPDGALVGGLSVVRWV